MSDIIVKPVEVFLWDPDNWSDWYRTFETRAYAANIWKYIDPDSKLLLEEPDFPVPWDTTNITSDMANKFTFYKLLLLEYQSRMTPYRELIAWVQSTVEQSWYQLCIDPKGDLYKTIKELWEKVSFSEGMEKERIWEKYK